MATAVTDALYAEMPELIDRYGAIGREADVVSRCVHAGLAALATSGEL